MPTPDWYRPAPHFAHELDPGKAWYVPGLQNEQTLDPAEENFPAEHEAHLEARDEPEVDRYVPTPHSMHPVEAAAGWYDPGAHFTQALFPLPSWYLPATQFVHPVCASEAWNCPGPHKEHVVEP